MADQRHRRRSMATADQRAFDDAVDALAFTKSWLPYGGPDGDEIFLHFGLSPADFGERLIVAMQSPRAIEQADISEHTLLRIREQVNAYLDRARHTDHSAGESA